MAPHVWLSLGCECMQSEESLALIFSAKYQAISLMTVPFLKNLFHVCLQSVDAKDLVTGHRCTLHM